MDNAEVHAGLTDAAWIAADVWNDAAEAGWYSSKATALKTNYDGVLWLSASSAYSRARLDGAPPDAWSPDVWFPDATTQPYPFMYGVISPTSARATGIWNRLNSAWPAWTQCQMTDPDGDQEPFSEVGYAAAVRGDHARARDYLSACASRWATRDWPYNVRHAGMNALTEKLTP